MRSRLLFLSAVVHAGAIASAGVWLGSGSAARTPRPALRITVLSTVTALELPPIAEPPAEEWAAEPPAEHDLPLSPNLPIPHDDFRDLLPEPPVWRALPPLHRPQFSENAYTRIRPIAAATPATVVQAELLDEFNTPPQYPWLARRWQQEGKVTVRLTIDVGGQVVRVEVARSSGYPLLDRAATTAAQQWRFRPTTSDGIAIEDSVLQDIVFRLRDPASPTPVLKQLPNPEPGQT